MNTRLKLLGMLLQKDLRLFWLLVVLTVAINAITEFPGIVERFEVLGGLLAVVGALATGLLILLVFHEDAVVGAKRDWLTRPVPGMVMLASKCLFVVLFILLPWVLAVVLKVMHEGYPLGEALVSGIADSLDGELVMFFLCVMAVAALTANILQAIVALLVCTVVGFVFAMAVFDVPADEGVRPGYFPWMLARPVELLVTFAAMAVLWIQYRRHRSYAALVLVGVVVLAAGTFLFTMSSPRMFSLQKRLSPEPAAESSVAVSLLPGCFPTRTLEGRSGASASPTAQVPVGIFPEAQWARLGDGAVAFAVRLVVDRLPEGGRLVLSRAELAYRTADGGTVPLGGAEANSKLVLTESGMPAMDRYWMLSKQQYQKLVADPSVATHVDYSLSLLAPSATAVFIADGRRKFYDGIGYCGATAYYRTTGEVNVDCYRAGDQPALLVARMEGEPDIEGRASQAPDFAPAILDFWGGRRHYFQLHFTGSTVSRVQVTAYEARAHFTRQFDVPGVLGGPVSSCPMP